MYSLKCDPLDKIQLYFFSGNLFDPLDLVSEGASCEASSELDSAYACENAVDGVLSDGHYGKKWMDS